MRRVVLVGLTLASAALLLGYGAAFLLRWGPRGLAATVILGVALAAAGAVAHGAVGGRGARLAAAGAYLLLTAMALLVQLDAYKNDLIRDLLYVQAIVGLFGAIGCAWPRPDRA
jgi:hypothetical protein